ncbi:conserved hypothetical protein [Desulfovibrionales bacterium]
MAMTSEQTDRLDYQQQSQQIMNEHIVEIQSKVASNPNCGIIQYNIGMAHLARRDWRSAELAFYKAVDNSPTLVEAYVQLGGIALHRGDLESCLNFNRIAAQIRIRFAPAWGNIGYVYMQRGEISEAIKALEKAISFDSRFVQALATLGSAYLAKGDPVACINVCRCAVETEPQFGPAWNNMGLAYLEQGDSVNALECLDKAVATGFEVSPEVLAEAAQCCSRHIAAMHTE